MASRQQLVQLLCERQEKQPFDTAQTSLLDQLLFDVNRAYRYAYNHSDLSFKTRVNNAYIYTTGGSNPVPADFLSFQQTGRVYNKATNPPQELEYMPWFRILDWVWGTKKNRTGAPRFFSVGGPQDQSTSLRDFVLAPTPNTATVNLTLIYQATPQADGVTDELDPNSWTNEITPIPATWHTTLLLDLAILFRKMDKGLSQEAQNALLSEAMKQFMTQEPHGRERPRTLPRFPAWGGGRRRFR